MVFCANVVKSSEVALLHYVCSKNLNERLCFMSKFKGCINLGMVILIIALAAFVLYLKMFTPEPAAAKEETKTITVFVTPIPTANPTPEPTFTPEPLPPPVFGKIYYSQDNPNNVTLKIQNEFSLSLRKNIFKLSINGNKKIALEDGFYLVKNGDLQEISLVETISLLDKFDKNLSIINVVDLSETFYNYQKVRFLSHDQTKYYWIYFCTQDYNYGSDEHPLLEAILSPRFGIESKNEESLYLDSLSSEIIDLSKLKN